MKCPTHKVSLEVIGYSIFDIVMGCPECDYEKDVPRTFDNKHLVTVIDKEVDIPD